MVKLTSFEINTFTTVLFLSSLVSFIFSGLAVLSLLSFIFCILLIFIFSRNIYLVKKDFLIFMTVAGIFFSITFLTIFYGINIDSKRLIGVLVAFGSILIAYLLRHKFTSNIFQNVIVIHLTFFYLQFFAYYLFNIEIDFLIFSENTSRNLGGVFTIPFTDIALMRSSGLFSEPGTYSNIMFLLYLGWFFKRVDPKPKDNLISNLLIFSLFVSFSTFGIIFALAIFFSRQTNFAAIVLISVVVLLFVIPYLASRFFDDGAISLDSGLGFRAEYISSALENFSSIRGWLIGEGALSAPVYFVDKEGADNDSGLIFYILNKCNV